MGVSDEQTAQPASASVQWARQHFTLLPQCGAYWHERGALVIADPHFGKAEHFRRSGTPVPGGTTADNLRRLDAMLDATGAGRLIILGDVFHARESVSAPVVAQLQRWRERRAALRIEAVRGNHDAHAGPAPAALGMADAGDTLNVSDILLRHEPVADDAGRHVMAGHVHPAARLHGVALRSARLPCFHFAPRVATLPAFGAFTGMHVIRPHAGDRIFAIGPEGVFAVPT